MMRRIFLGLLMVASLCLAAAWVFTIPPQRVRVIIPQTAKARVKSLSLRAVKGELTPAQCYALAKQGPFASTLADETGYPRNGGPDNNAFDPTDLLYPIQGTGDWYDGRYCEIRYDSHDDGSPKGHAQVTLGLAGPGFHP